MTPSDVQTAIDSLSAKVTEVAVYRRYIDGDSDLRAAAIKTRSMFGGYFRAASDNLVPAIIESMASRLALGAFTFSTDDEQASERWAEIAADLARYNKLSIISDMVHREALGVGDAAVIVQLDRDGLPRFYPQRADLFYVEYETPADIAWAAKRWMEEGTGGKKVSRLTMIYPGRVERYAATVDGEEHPTKAVKYQPYSEEGTPAVSVLPDQSFPVFHFANRRSLDGTQRPEFYECTGLIDYNNFVLASTFVGVEAWAYPQRFATGLQVETDPVTGKPKPLTPGEFWFVTGKDATFGQFDAGDISRVVEVSESLRKEIARVSQTPLHYFSITNDFPSGESLRVAETPLQNKVANRRMVWGEAWQAAVAYGMRLLDLGLTRPIANWLDLAVKDERQEVETALLRVQLGVDRATALREIGYTQREADLMLGQAEPEAEMEPQEEQEAAE